MKKKKDFLYTDDYKVKLKQFMAEINKKPDREELERILNKIRAEQVGRYDD
jgi:hypothetical protein